MLNRKPIRYNRRALRELSRSARLLKKRVGMLAGDTLIVKITAACALIASNPRLGRKRPEFGVPHLHSHPARRHTIFYQNLGDRIEILRIIPQRRDPDAVLQRWVRRQSALSPHDPE